MAGPSGRRPRPGDGTEPRRVAIEAVRRIDEDGAYANLLLRGLLDTAGLDQRDRGLVTELVYGATRMRRAVDWLVDRYLVSPPGPALRASLRVGAYQLAFTRVPPHAAVDATVGASAKRNRPAVNAVLRRVADSLPVEWPDAGTRLSYPDWLIDRLVRDLGSDDAIGALEKMNEAPGVSERPDGYVQDPASQWVVDEVAALSRGTVLDLCAAPGGKATGLVGAGAPVVASDVRLQRSRLIAVNAKRLGHRLPVVTADGLAPPFRRRSFDTVLVDAPCSGLGVLRRRPDARWRVSERDVASLARLQGRLLEAAAPLVCSGGILVYSVCTMTTAETIGVADGFARAHPQARAVAPDGPHWRPLGEGGLVLPQDHDTDAMAVFLWTLT